MSADPKSPPEPGSSESLGLDKDAEAAASKKAPKRVEDKGEPFDGNFA